MVNKGAVCTVGAVISAIALTVILAQRASAKCRLLDEPMRYYYLKYTGPDQTFKDALGECYDVIYTIDVWDEELGEYWPPTDPVNDIILSGSECRVMVQEPCTLCGFKES